MTNVHAGIDILLNTLSAAGQNPQVNPLIKHFQEQNAPLGEAPGYPAVIRELLAKPVSYFKECPSVPDTHTEPLTQVAFLLDESSSMNHGKEATIEGFNTQVSVVREGATIAGKTLFTDVRFSTETRLRCVAGDLTGLVPLTQESYQPMGGTALYDAIGDAIAALLQTEGISSPQTATLLTVFTDGEENASRKYTSAVVKALIERLEATGRWTFALVGPRQTVGTLASVLSVNHKNVSGYDVNSIAGKREAFSKAASASATYMSLRSVGGTQSASLYDDEGSFQK